jgi:quercetin dioxygenase-like cupin family protein
MGTQEDTMSDFKPIKKNFWHYKEVPMDLKARELMPDFELQYVINEDTVPNNETLVWNHSIFPPGAQHHKHLHKNADEVAYVVSGRCIAGVTIDGKDVEQVCGPGMCIWASRGQAHWHKNPFDEPCEFVGVYCGCSSLEKSGYVDMRTDEEKKK